jgi:hypothetical protein
MAKLASDHWRRLFASDIELSTPFTELPVNWATTRTWQPASFKQPELSQFVGPPLVNHMCLRHPASRAAASTPGCRLLLRGARHMATRQRASECRHLTHRVSGKPAVQPNPSLKLTRSGRRCKPGPRHMVHHREPGLQRLPPRAA